MNSFYIKFDINSFDLNVKKIVAGEDIKTNYLNFMSYFGLLKDQKYNILVDNYFKEKFIFNRLKIAEELLFNIFKNFDVTQIICQNLIGYKCIKKSNVNYLLKYFNIELEDSVMTSYIMILNKLGFLSYNKKSGIITILYNSFEEQREDFKLPDITLLNPEKPYTNRLLLRKYVKEAKGYIYWLDKYLDKNIFEILLLEVDSNNISEIKLLTSKSQHIDENFKVDFELLKAEFSKKGISLECNLLKKGISKIIHDRWFITKGRKFNFPSFQSFFKGQFAEIKETTNCIEFSKWWSDSRELIS